MPGAYEFLLGKPQSVQQLSTHNPQQQQILSQILGQLAPALQGSDFGGIEKEARRGFEQQTIPTIMERLTSMGGGRSSALGQQLGAAGAGFESQLGGLRSQHQQRQLQMLLGAGLQPTMENLIMPEQQGLLQALLSALAGGAGLASGASLAQFGGSGLSSLGQLLGGSGYNSQNPFASSISF